MYEASSARAALPRVVGRHVTALQRILMLLTDAELVLGLSRHLAAYAGGSAKAELEQLEFAGQVLDISFRLRGSGTSSPERVHAIGVEAGLGRRRLRDVVATLDSLNWVSVQRATSGEALSISELLPVPQFIVSLVPQILAVAEITPLERAALGILRATTIQPLLLEEAKAAGIERHRHRRR